MDKKYYNMNTRKKGWIGFTFSDQSGQENRRGKDGLGSHFQIKVDKRTEGERVDWVYIFRSKWTRKLNGKERRWSIFYRQGQGIKV
jgi:hypothetical protein